MRTEHVEGICFEPKRLPGENQVACGENFLACFAADVEKLSACDRAIYRYLLQPHPAGPSELFAECFAATQGGCAIEYWTKKMPEIFPQSYNFVLELVGKLNA